MTISWQLESHVVSLCCSRYLLCLLSARQSRTLFSAQVICASRFVFLKGLFCAQGEALCRATDTPVELSERASIT
jgi:hypothetical protein